MEAVRPRPAENPDYQRLHDCHTCSTARGPKVATDILIRFRLLSDTGHSICHRRAADLRRTWTNHSQPLDLASRQGHRAKLACWKKDNLEISMRKTPKTS